MKSLDALRRIAVLLDSRFRIPGTDIRFGLDPILSLIPGLGDLASPVYTALLLAQGLRQGVPRIVMLRMVGNALLDAIIGAIPIAGNVGDIFFRANNANLALLERHRHPGRPPERGDYVFVGVLSLLLGVFVVVPLIVGLYLFTQLLDVLGRGLF